MPISFTAYSMDRERLYCRTGFLTERGEQIPLYRVTDVHYRITLFQRLFGVGNVTVYSGDDTAPRLELASIKNPLLVRRTIYDLSEAAKRERRIRLMKEGGGDGEDSGDNDPLNF